MRKIIVLATTVLLLAGVNWGIYQKERLLTSGRIVLLKLAPVDPRSLMQGDYMALRFAVANRAFQGGHSESADGRVVLTLDEQGVASFQRFDDGSLLRDEEVVMRYRVRHGQVKFATNAFFFQEGQGGLYQDAKYGEFRVAANGQSLLTGLRDEELRRLGAKE